MKLVMDEKLKHRLIGLAVIISLGAIFAPAVMKKSSQHIDSNFSSNVQMPAKPVAPNVVMSDEKEMFKTIKIAKVNIPSVSEDNQLQDLAKAEMIKSDLIANHKTPAMAKVKVVNELNAEPIKLALNQAAKNSAKKTVTIAAKKTAKNTPVLALKKTVTPQNTRARVIAKNNKKPAIRSSIYAVQLASFSQITNAQSLVNKLRAKGYKASFMKVSGRQGNVYKVYAGHSPSRTDVVRVKTQLASAMQLNGFIVNTGVS